MEIKSKKQFEELKKQGPVLVDFYTAWCGPCKTQSKILEDGKETLLKNFPTLTVCKADITNECHMGKIADKIGIRAIPYLVLFNGKVCTNGSGVKRLEDIIAFLKKYINN